VNPNVSIVLPTFNRTRSLGAAMNSVLSQSYEDFELIVVDDASTEDVAGLVDGFRDPRVRYVRRETNGGAAAARNTGLAHAKGKLIAFQDSDDLWLPGKLMKQVALFSVLPDHVRVVTGAKIIYGRDADYNYGSGKVACAPPPEGRMKIDEDQLERLLTENRISLQNALFRRDCIADAQWFDSCARANEDWEFAIRLVQQSTVYEDIEPVVLGFISSDSISTNPHRQTMGVLRILRKNKAILASRKRHRSRMRIELAVALYRAGKKRPALKFMRAGLKDHPAHIGWVATSLVRRSFKTLVRSLRPVIHPVTDSVRQPG
jgi:glycosyltransferase involved in cell wall biosynthesis